MFFKPANSDTENGIKKYKMSPEEKHMQRKLELEMTFYERYQNNIAKEVEFLT